MSGQGSMTDQIEGVLNVEKSQCLLDLSPMDQPSALSGVQVLRLSKPEECW